MGVGRRLSGSTKNRKLTSRIDPLPLGSSIFPLEEQKLQNLYRAPFISFDLIRSGLSPGRGDPTAWYDRAIRMVGGIILLLFFIAMIVFGWIKVFGGG